MCLHCITGPVLAQGPIHLAHQPGQLVVLRPGGGGLLGPAVHLRGQALGHVGREVPGPAQKGAVLPGQLVQAAGVQEYASHHVRGHLLADELCGALRLRRRPVKALAHVEPDVGLPGRVHALLQPLRAVGLFREVQQLVHQRAAVPHIRRVGELVAEGIHDGLLIGQLIAVQLDRVGVRVIVAVLGAVHAEVQLHRGAALLLAQHVVGVLHRPLLRLRGLPLSLRVGLRVRGHAVPPLCCRILRLGRAGIRGYPRAPGALLCLLGGLCDGVCLPHLVEQDCVRVLRLRHVLAHAGVLVHVLPDELLPAPGAAVAQPHPLLLRGGLLCCGLLCCGFLCCGFLRGGLRPGLLLLGHGLVQDGLGLLVRLCPPRLRGLFGLRRLFRHLAGYVAHSLLLGLDLGLPALRHLPYCLDSFGAVQDLRQLHSGRLLEGGAHPGVLELQLFDFAVGQGGVAVHDALGHLRGGVRPGRIQPGGILPYAGHRVHHLGRGAAVHLRRRVLDGLGGLRPGARGLGSVLRGLAPHQAVQLADVLAGHYGPAAAVQVPGDLRGLRVGLGLRVVGHARLHQVILGLAHLHLLARLGVVDIPHGVVCAHLRPAQNAADHRAAQELLHHPVRVHYGVLAGQTGQGVALVVDHVLHQLSHRALNDLFLALVQHGLHPVAHESLGLVGQLVDTAAPDLHQCVQQAVHRGVGVGGHLARAVRQGLLVVLAHRGEEGGPILRALHHFPGRRGQGAHKAGALGRGARRQHPRGRALGREALASRGVGQHSLRDRGNGGRAVLAQQLTYPACLGKLRVIRLAEMLALFLNRLIPLVEQSVVAQSVVPGEPFHRLHNQVLRRGQRGGHRACDLVGALPADARRDLARAGLAQLLLPRLLRPLPDRLPPPHRGVILLGVLPRVECRRLSLGELVQLLQVLIAHLVQLPAEVGARALLRPPGHQVPGGPRLDLRQGGGLPTRLTVLIALKEHRVPHLLLRLRRGPLALVGLGHLVRAVCRLPGPGQCPRLQLGDGVRLLLGVGALLCVALPEGRTLDRPCVSLGLLRKGLGKADAEIHTGAALIFCVILHRGIYLTS